MDKFTNPLNNIRIASPCKADWNEMYGSERKRFCAECKLNVYNLSDMTRTQAEQLLFESEGRLCVKFFRRSDGTVITKDCPVGWKRIKKHASKVTVAMSSLVIGFFSGIFATRATDAAIAALPIGDVPAQNSSVEQEQLVPTLGEVEDMVEWEGKVDLNDLRRAGLRIKRTTRQQVLGRVQDVEQMDKKKVVAWIK